MLGRSPPVRRVMPSRSGFQKVADQCACAPGWCARNARCRDRPASSSRPLLDGLLGAETVAVKNLPLEQVSHRSKVDVRMGTHVDALVGEELGRAHLVEKDEG